MRGPFRRGGEIEARSRVFHVRRPGEYYDPTSEGVEVELAKVIGAVRSSSEAANADPVGDQRARAFVERYGVLEVPTDADASVSADAIRKIAAELRNVLSLYYLLRLTASGKARGLEGLRRWAKAHPEDAKVASDADRDALIASAQRWISGAVTRRSSTVRYALRPAGGAADRFVRRPRPQTLLGHIYATVASMIVNGKAVEICDNPDCRTPFEVRDLRMSFCSDKCRAHARYLRIKDALARVGRARRKGR